VVHREGKEKEKKTRYPPSLLAKEKGFRESPQRKRRGGGKKEGKTPKKKTCYPITALENRDKGGRGALNHKREHKRGKKIPLFHLFYYRKKKMSKTPRCKGRKRGEASPRFLFPFLLRARKEGGGNSGEEVNIERKKKKEKRGGRDLRTIRFSRSFSSSRKGGRRRGGERNGKTVHMLRRKKGESEKGGGGEGKIIRSSADFPPPTFSISSTKEG